MTHAPENFTSKTQPHLTQECLLTCTSSPCGYQRVSASALWVQWLLTAAQLITAALIASQFDLSILSAAVVISLATPFPSLAVRDSMEWPASTLFIFIFLKHSVTFSKFPSYQNQLKRSIVRGPALHACSTLFDWICSTGNLCLSWHKRLKTSSNVRRQWVLVHRIIYCHYRTQGCGWSPFFKNLHHKKSKKLQQKQLSLHCPLTLTMFKVRPRSAPWSGMQRWSRVLVIRHPTASGHLAGAAWGILVAFARGRAVIHTHIYSKRV